MLICSPFFLVSLGVVSLFFSSLCFSFVFFLVLSCLFSFLYCGLCLFSDSLGSVFYYNALVCFPPARFLAWGVCLSPPSPGNLPGFFLARYVFDLFNCFIFVICHVSYFRLVFGVSSPLVGV